MRETIQSNSNRRSLDRLLLQGVSPQYTLQLQRFFCIAKSKKTHTSWLASRWLWPTAMAPLRVMVWKKPYEGCHFHLQRDPKQQISAASLHGSFVLGRDWTIPIPWSPISGSASCVEARPHTALPRRLQLRISYPSIEVLQSLCKESVQGFRNLTTTWHACSRACAMAVDACRSGPERLWQPPTWDAIPARAWRLCRQTQSAGSWELQSIGRSASQFRTGSGNECPRSDGPSLRKPRRCTRTRRPARAPS